MTTLLSKGIVHSITQNTVYALPPGNKRVQAGATIQTSLATGSGFADLTNSASQGGAETSAPFLKCATGDTTVIVG